MVKNGICLVGGSKQNALFSENMPQTNAPMHAMYPMHLECILFTLFNLHYDYT